MCHMDGSGDCRAVEMVCGHIVTILARVEYMAQRGVAVCPVPSIEVVVADAGEIGEVGLEGGLTLPRCEPQLMGHPVGEDEGLTSGLSVTHGLCRECHGDNCCKCKYKPFHFCYLFKVIHHVVNSDAKISKNETALRMFFPIRVEASPYLSGGNPPILLHYHSSSGITGRGVTWLGLDGVVAAGAEVAGAVVLPAGAGLAGGVS